MPHIHNGPGEHDLTVCAHIFRLDGDEPRIVLHVHKKKGYLLPVGGHVELTETPWQAILHEIKEEAGYDTSQLKVLQPLERLAPLPEVDHQPQPFVLLTHEFMKDHRHTDISWVFVTDGDPQHPVAVGESPDVRFYTKQQLQQLPIGAIPENVRETGLYIFDRVLSSWEALPVKKQKIISKSHGRSREA